MFKELEGLSAILLMKGTFLQVPLFTLGEGALFAKVGTGFVRLYGDGSTSKAHMSVKHLSIEDHPLYVGPLGYMYTMPGPKREVFDDPRALLQLEDKS